MTDGAPPNGRTALVTGAARGLGRAIATRLLRDGFAVAVVDIDTRSFAGPDALEREFGARFYRAPIDVTDRAQIERVAAQMLER